MAGVNRRFLMAGFLSLHAAFAVAQDNEEAFQYYVDNVSGPVVQDKCIACHVDGGIAQATRLVYQPDSVANYQTLNYQQWVDLAAEQSDLADYALGKAQGVGHGGGVQLVAGSPEFIALSEFLDLLVGSGGGGNTSDFFEDFALADHRETYRRAAMLVAGTLPSEAELDAAAAASESQLRDMLRDLMQGEGFHEFLITGANDRLLTDKFIEETPNQLFMAPYYPDLANQAAALSDGGGSFEDIYTLVQGTAFGIARQPLELIAYVVEQELPYTEILTADYTLVNPQLALAYRSNVNFEDEENINQWKLGTVEGYTRLDDSITYEQADPIGAYVTGGLATDYPHAGVLNTPGWLARYPSTATNRNRARSRWTWYHFLGFDIERSAPRTTDPDALADTDNPTLNNPNCTVCHDLMDPIAGAYQNYGDDGFYKDQGGGIDSLPRNYKREQDTEDPYQPGDVWYRDMLAPAFEGQPLTNTDNTIQGLAQSIVNDPRFSVGAVKFWWPSLMGEEAARSPEDEGDVDYQANLELFLAQSADIAGFAAEFETGINGGSPYNVKDLLVELLMSPWFRASRIQQAPQLADAAYAAVGAGKLLTPEELDRKTEAITGYRWYESEDQGVVSSRLLDDYRLFYGGIDSDGVSTRATEMTALMSTVVEAQPLQMACLLVGIEFNLPVENRLLFPLVNRFQHDGNAEDVIREQLVYLHERFLGEALTTNSGQISLEFSLFAATRAERVAENRATRLNGDSNESCPFQFLDTQDWNLNDPLHSLNTWISMLIYYMTDYRYVYQ